MCRCCGGDMNRRTFLGAGAAMAAATGLTAMVPRAVNAQAHWAEDWWDPERPYMVAAKPLRVQPVLMYRVAEPRPQSSYKSWGGVQSHEAAAEEAGRIGNELAGIAKDAPSSCSARGQVTSHVSWQKSSSEQTRRPVPPQGRQSTGRNGLANRDLRPASSGRCINW